MSSLAFQKDSDALIKHFMAACVKYFEEIRVRSLKFNSRLLKQTRATVESDNIPSQVKTVDVCPGDLVKHPMIDDLLLYYVVCLRKYLTLI